MSSVGDVGGGTGTGGHWGTMGSAIWTECVDGNSGGL